MAGQSGIDPSIAEWIEARQDEIARALRASRYAARQGDRQRETLDLLTHLAEIHRASRDAIHLLTGYAVRGQVASATQVAAASGTTVSTATSRAGSPVTHRVWADVYPDGRATP